MISVIITHLCRAELMRVEKFSHIAFQIVTVEMYLVYRVQSIENFVFFGKRVTEIMVTGEFMGERTSLIEMLKTRCYCSFAEA